MKKRILKIVFASAFALAAGYSIYASQQNAEMSDLALANVEALAQDEGFDLNDLNKNCYWYNYEDCYYIIVSPSGNTVWWHSNFEERR